jgi:hypothetical protein
LQLEQNIMRRVTDTGPERIMEFPKNEGKDFNPESRGEIAWVQCIGYRCLAYRDKNGKWRRLYDNEVLLDVVREIPDD